MSSYWYRNCNTPSTKVSLVHPNHIDASSLHNNCLRPRLIQTAAGSCGDVTRALQIAYLEGGTGGGWESPWDLRIVQWQAPGTNAVLSPNITLALALPSGPHVQNI